MDEPKICCYNCEHLADFAGNYVECVLLHCFVDWYYWNAGTRPDNCPLLNENVLKGEDDAEDIPMEYFESGGI